MQKFLPQLLTFFTGKVRQKTKIDWNSGLFIDKPFRLWELLFWQKFGIRAEASASASVVDGKLYIKREFYTLEAVLSHTEATIRSYFSSLLARSLSPDRHTSLLPEYAYVSIALAGLVIAFKTKTHGLILPMIGMAIALDTSATGSGDGGNSFNFAYTCTGSNRKLFLGMHNGGGDTTSTITYGAGSMSQTEKSAAGNLTEYIYLYDLTGPASGSNTLTCNRSSGSGARFRVGVISYTGCNGTIDSHGNNKAHGGTVTVTLTVVASSCWIVGSGGGQDPASAGTGMTSRANPGGVVVGDSNGTVGTGSQSIAASDSGTGDCGVCAAAFQPGVQSTAYTITAAQGSYTLTGQTTNFTRPIRYMVAALGTFALTGQAVIFRTGKGMIASTGYYVLTGIAALFRFTGWVPEAKSSAPSWSAQSKSSSPTWTAETKT